MRNFTAMWGLRLAVLLGLLCGFEHAHAESRFALVIGNADYRGFQLATATNDAGLIADTLQSAGFTVTGARDLDQTTLRETLREFVAQVSAAGPDAVALVYLSGIGLQFNGDNYFVPVDADIRRAIDVPLQAVRISDFTAPLAALPARVKIVVLDAARANPFAREGEPLAGGLALIDPVPGMVFAFNAAPGTVGPNERGPYGAYATALTEMISAGGYSLDDIFARVRLRVSDLTQGAEIPWYVSQLAEPLYLTERVAGAPPPSNIVPFARIRRKPLREYSDVDEAYEAVLELDTIDAYEQFLALYPRSRYAERVAAMLAVRREEIIWRHCVGDDTPRAYWSYLRRYPHGPHAWDARRRLAILRAAAEPPDDFAAVDFGVPPPPPTEQAFVDRPIVIFSVTGWSPPPSPPTAFLPARPREFSALRPPPPPRQRFALPVPAAVIFPKFVSPPAAVRRPPSTPAARGGAHDRVVPVALPKAVLHASAPSSPATPQFHRAPTAPITPQLHQAPKDSGAGATTHRRGPPLQPSTAAVKPGGVQPPQSAPRAVLKPGQPLQHPEPPRTVSVKPAPKPASTGAPTVVKPVHPPEHRVVHPAAVNGSQSPPHPAISAPGSPPNARAHTPPQKPTSVVAKPAHTLPANRTPVRVTCPTGKHLTPEGCK